MEYVEFEINTERDPWWMRQKRVLLWLCIYKYCKGSWRIVNIDIVIKIAKIIYSLPLELKNTVYWSFLNPTIKAIYKENAWVRVGGRKKLRSCNCGRPLFGAINYQIDINKSRYLKFCGLSHSMKSLHLSEVEEEDIKTRLNQCNFSFYVDFGLSDKIIKK
jgi:hypothetical protein